jgi:hypothetical protein
LAFAFGKASSSESYRRRRKNPLNPLHPCHPRSHHAAFVNMERKKSIDSFSNPFSGHVFFVFPGVKLGKIWQKLSCTLLFEWKVIEVEINLKAYKINRNTLGL